MAAALNQVPIRKHDTRDETTLLVAIISGPGWSAPRKLLASASASVLSNKSRSSRQSYKPDAASKTPFFRETEQSTTRMRLKIVCSLLVLSGSLLMVGGVPQANRLSDLAMECKRVYAPLCRLNPLPTPSFLKPICLKKQLIKHNSVIINYYTYPHGACGLSDICWNPNLSVHKQDICGIEEDTSSCTKRSSRYRNYRWRGEKLPTPSSGRRSVYLYAHCAKPYDCQRMHDCYGFKFEKPDPNRTDIKQFCRRLHITAEWSVYYTYTLWRCLEQDTCWEPNLVKVTEGQDGHCATLGIKLTLASEVLRGRVRLHSGWPQVFGRDR